MLNYLHAICYDTSFSIMIRENSFKKLLKHLISRGKFLTSDV